MSSRPHEPEFEVEELTPIRQAIGERTGTSFRDIPQFWMQVLVDAEALVAARNKRKEQGEAVPTYNDYFIKAVATIIGDYPEMNAWCEDGQVKLLKPINIGFACATDDGVLLPTVFDADKKSVDEIAENSRELIELARGGRLRASLQMGAGFTISNIGPTVVDAFNAIISPPQTAILAIGAMKKRPMMVDDEIVARISAYLTLTVDHRVLDATQAVPFLNDLVELLANSDWLEQL